MVAGVGAAYRKIAFSLDYRYSVESLNLTLSGSQ